MNTYSQTKSYMKYQRIKKLVSKNKGRDNKVALIGLDAEYGRIR